MNLLNLSQIHAITIHSKTDTISAKMLEFLRVSNRLHLCLLYKALTLYVLILCKAADEMLLFIAKYYQVEAKRYFSSKRIDRPQVNKALFSSASMLDVARTKSNIEGSVSVTQIQCSSK